MVGCCDQGERAHLCCVHTALSIPVGLCCVSGVPRFQTVSGDPDAAVAIRTLLGRVVASADAAVTQAFLKPKPSARALDASQAQLRKQPTLRIKHKKVKRRLRSRNAAVDAWLVESASDGDCDNYADLEEFIVPDDEEAT